MVGWCSAADAAGAKVAEASEHEEEVIVAGLEVEQNRRQGVAGGVFRDRRPELYGDILTRDGAQRR